MRDGDLQGAGLAYCVQLAAELLVMSSGFCVLYKAGLQADRVVHGHPHATTPTCPPRAAAPQPHPPILTQTPIMRTGRDSICCRTWSPSSACKPWRRRRASRPASWPWPGCTTRAQMCSPSQEPSACGEPPLWIQGATLGRMVHTGCGLGPEHSCSSLAAESLVFQVQGGSWRVWSWRADAVL